MTMDLPAEPVLQEAARWLERLRAAPRDRAEQSEFQAWLRADDAHVRAMEAIERGWLAAGMLEGDASLRAARRGRPVAVRRAWRPAFAAVACMLVAVVAVGVWQAETVEPVLYQTARGERHDVQLPDGSRLLLNSDTRLTVRDLWRARKIELQAGEAEFVVAHDPLRPFTVRTDQVVVRAVGTDFAVRRDDGSVSVTLVSGIVELRDPANDTVAARMAPDQQALIKPGKLNPQFRNVKVADELAWRSGHVVFERTRLADALHAFARYTGSEPVLASPELAALEVSGRYRTTDLPAFLDGLAKIHPLRWVRQGNGDIVLSRRP
jgi:transmembrane sensor